MNAMYLSRSAVVGKPEAGDSFDDGFGLDLWPSGRRKICTIVREISRLAVEAKKPSECRLFSTRTRSTSSTTTGRSWLGVVVGSGHEYRPGQHDDVVVKCTMRQTLKTYRISLTD